METEFLLPIFRGSHKTRHLHCIYHVSDEKVELSDQILGARPRWVGGDWRRKCKQSSDVARRGANRLYRSRAHAPYFRLPSASDGCSRQEDDRGERTSSPRVT